MDPAPDVGQLRGDTVDTRLGALGSQNFQHNFQPAAPNPHHATSLPIDPDDFYKNYRGPNANTGPDLLPMAATSSSRPFLRSNGDSNPARTNLRSVSSPLDCRSSATSTTAQPSSKPSVKDLTKRFDQNAMVKVATTPPQSCTTSAGSKIVTSRVVSSVNSSSQLSSHRNAACGDGFSGGSSTVRTSSLPIRQSKFVAEDQSFASRVAKPRSSAHREDSSQKPTITGQRKSPPQRLPQPASSTSPHHQTQGLLFGELAPTCQHRESVLGYGIDEIRPRRTSESGVHSAASRQRNVYSPDACGRLSPSFFNRSPPFRTEGAVTDLVPRPKTRSRAHSDDGGSSPSSRAARHQLSKLSPKSSKLPVSVRKLSTPSNLSSPPSTRSSSPSTLKRHQANGRPTRTSPEATRAKTPTQTRRSGLQINSNARLQAYIATPPSKLSPTLRSSRPRQPVSIASTSSTRMNETDQHRTGRMGEQATRRRKVSIGPIDFEQRREHIRLAYTKSIRESEALEARHKAEVEKARQELEDASLSQDASEHSASGLANPSIQASSGEPSALTISVQDRPDHENEPSAAEVAEFVTERNAPQAAPTSFEPLTTPPLAISSERQAYAFEQDSPTLGLPGSFPDCAPSRISDKRTLSTASVASDTTEFDTEPQTKPPVRALPPVKVPITVIKPAIHQTKQSQDFQQLIEYRYLFEEAVDSSLEVSPKTDRYKFKNTELHQAPTVADSYKDGTNKLKYEGLGIDSFQFQDTSTLVPGSQSPVISNKTGKDTVPSPRPKSHCDSDWQSESDQQAPVNRRYLEGDNTCMEAENDHDEEVNLDSRNHHENCNQSYRTSTCASSEAGVYEQSGNSNYEQHAHQTHDVSPGGNLLVPTSRHHNESLSRQSAWTDLSVDSVDRSDLARLSVIPSHHESPSFGHATIFSSQTESPVNDISYSRRGVDELVSHRSPSAQYNSLHLPEVDTGDGFSIPYFSPEPNDIAPYPPSPNHEPPPVPPSSVPGSGINSRASSAYYEQSQYESTLLNSEQESDEFTSRADTSQSVDSSSLPTTEQFMSTHTLADGDSKSLAHDVESLTDKERHRLIQRRNVMKELIDTEAVFVRDMNIVEEIYKGTAEACPKLDSKTVKLIFRNSDEIIAFHTAFLSEIKEGVANVYMPNGSRVTHRDDSSVSTPSTGATDGPSDAKDRSTSLGPVFKGNIEQMKLVHEGFLRASDQAAKRIIQIQQDPTVQVWLNECNEVAKDLTAAWDLDSLLIKPMQRITKYPNLIITLLQHTPQDHPDREALMEAKDILEAAIIEINKTKKNFELVGQIVGRKRKESDVKAGFARAFGKRVDKLQTSNNRPADDADYAKLNEKFGDDYLRLQVVLRDVEFYTRQISAYVHEFLQYMSSIELVMRLQPGNYPELESKWVQFNISVRDLEKVALEEHLSQVRKLVIEPFEQVIKAYGNPSLAMKKRQKRRLDFERFEQLRRSGKSPDPKLKELVEQYDALNDTLKKELPQLSALTEKIGNICLGNFVNIQAKWYSIWKDKMRAVLSDCSDMPDIQGIVTSFEQDIPYANEQLANLGILNPATWGRTSHSASISADEASHRPRVRPADPEARSRGQSINGDAVPTLPAPDFGGRRSGSFTLSPSSLSATGFANGNVPSPHQYYYRDFYAGIASNQGRLISPQSPEFPSSSRFGAATGVASTRPSTGRSYESGMQRQSSDLTGQSHRDSSTTYNSNSAPQEMQRDTHRFSNMFRSAMPMSDGPDEGNSQWQSRASSRDCSHPSDGYNVLWLAASLFEFNIVTTKHEAGYPYLTYQAGEIFDVIAEKGELWLAKNQDDPADQVGWIWSKHFAKLADS